jgi:hypothetical protein
LSHDSIEQIRHALNIAPLPSFNAFSSAAALFVAFDAFDLLLLHGLVRSSALPLSRPWLYGYFFYAALRSDEFVTFELLADQLVSILSAASNRTMG